MAFSHLERLPAELVLQISTYLDDDDVIAIQSSSRHLRTVCRHCGFWRARCFGDSRLASTLRRKNWRRDPADPQSEKSRRIDIRAAWHSMFDTGESISWYDEHIQRSGNITTNWFEIPRSRDNEGRPLSSARELEVCGVGLYRPPGTAGGDPEDDNREGDSNKLEGIPALLAVAPLEDGAVCLWDVNGTVGERGAIVQQSAPGLLFSGIQNAQNERPIFSVTECVAVDSTRSLAYFAIQNQLVEVDLQTLSVVSTKKYPQAITALSPAHPSVPLSIGTSVGILLHDSRARPEDAAGTFGFKSVDERIDELNAAPFPPPGPLSIAHIQEQGLEGTASNDIFAAGRISSILHYDRRKLSVVKNAIHSGASLSGLTSIPYPFPSIGDYTRVRRGQTPATDLSAGGRTVVACGEYKSKGSLELYPVDGADPTKHMVNRQTSSSAKIFSVVSHGTLLAVSDGVGYIRWFERDGFTEVRKHMLGSDDYDEDKNKAPRNPAPPLPAPPASIQQMMGPDWPSASPLAQVQAPLRPVRRAHESGDIARKLLAAHTESTSSTCQRDDHFRNNGLLFWTGEKLGMVSFTRDEGTRSAGFIKDNKTPAERALEEEGDAYRQRVRDLFRSARYFGEDSDSDD